VADNILKTHPDADVRVIAVWQAIRGDGISDRTQTIFNDARVVQLSDPDLEIGTWFGDRDQTFHTGEGLAWDVFMLFGADATFATLADDLQASGRTIIADSGKLRDAFEHKPSPSPASS
jgi:hypothetical protein